MSLKLLPCNDPIHGREEADREWGPAPAEGTTELVLVALQPPETEGRTAQKLLEKIMAPNCPSLEENVNL